MEDDNFGTAGGSDRNDVALPKATVNKFANEIAHSLGVRLTADTRDLIANCCTEFVQLLSSEANDICEKDNKKTITPDHILRALSALGLEDYLQEVTNEYEKVRNEERVRGRGASKRDKKKKVGDTEELMRQQEALFAMARGDPMAAMSGSAPTTPRAPAGAAEAGAAGAAKAEAGPVEVAKAEDVPVAAAVSAPVSAPSSAPAPAATPSPPKQEPSPDDAPPQ